MKTSVFYRISNLCHCWYYHQQKLIYLITLFTLFLHNNVTGQVYNRPQETDMDEFVQRLFPVQEDDLDYESLYESIFQYYRQPLNLNRVTPEELRSLYILSETQINQFFTHKKKYGRFLSVYELQAIEGFDLETVKQVLPFVTLIDSNLDADNASLWQRIKREDNNYFIFRLDRTLQTKKGYKEKEDGSPKPYIGSPNRWYARYRVNHSKDFSLGFTLEKDAGEQFSFDPSQNQFGADFFSFHASLQNKGRLKHLTIGDYRIQVGQSLLLAAGFQAGKGSETTATTRRNTLGPLPYTSVLENGFFRGVAATLKYNQWEVSPFISYKNIDANRPGANQQEVDTSENNEAFVSSLLQSGLHRTKRERAGRDAIGEFVVGNHVQFKSQNQRLTLGATALYTQYEQAFIRKQNDYNQFFFRGKENWNWGINAHYNWQNFSFFGEVAQSKSKGLGMIGGWVASFSREMQMSMVFRNFERDFHSFYGDAFAETSGNNNERGIYWGLKYNPSRKWNFAAYYDLFWFPWLRFQADAPSQGQEALLRATWKISRKIQLYGQFRIEEKERNVPNNSTNTDILSSATRQQFLFNVRFNAERIVSLQTRWQFSNYQQEEYSEGMALMQDINFDFGRVRLSGRVALFDTDDFQNRQYAYEKDVLYAFSFPAYSGVGTRQYFLLRYKPNKKLDFWVKYAIFRYTDRDVISSGNEQIEGNKREDVRCQMRIKF